jgi:lipopolysaccharide export system protein LptA
MKKSALVIFPLMLAGAAVAAPIPSTGSSQPVAISAAKSLEWNRKARTYTAKQDVVVTQGVMNIRSDTLTARYTDAQGMTDITTLTAEGHVTINSPPYVATGEHAVYDVKTGNAVMTGGNLKIVTGSDVLTARDKIEFFGAENKMTATGDATAVRGDDVLKAAALNAYFVKDATGKMTASKITGAGNIVLKTAKETATADNGVYDIPSQTAVLTGKVRILQGENWLEGTRADVDMTTGISRLSGAGNAATEGRVKGVFYPKSMPGKNKEQ